MTTFKSPKSLFNFSLRGFWPNLMHILCSVRPVMLKCGAQKSHLNGKYLFLTTAELGTKLKHKVGHFPGRPRTLLILEREGVALKTRVGNRKRGGGAVKVTLRT